MKTFYFIIALTLFTLGLIFYSSNARAIDLEKYYKEDLTEVDKAQQFVGLLR